MKQQHRHAVITAALGIFAVLGASSASAHHIWIEQDAKSATLYFGEFDGNLRETTPGLLDKFAKPVAFKQSGEAAVAVELVKTAKGFASTVRVKPGESLVAEDPAHPISERKQGDQVTHSLYQPAARLSGDLRAQAPRLTLDLVPTGRQNHDGVELQAFYKGQPLPKAKVAVMTAFGWSQDRRADDAGKFSVKLPWRGTYVLELSHTDASGGERSGPAGIEKFDQARYVTSLTLVQPKGLAPLPAPPAATPNTMK